ncbi:MAG: hypothetical protein M5U19_07540 [Microthrixaceae bacterium]|nr:hypothetical protein [Microthrixaceae bacterium]
MAFWRDGVGYWAIGLGYAFVGAGVGFAGTPASHALTGSVPVTRAGMASGTADLQRDLGGAIMQSILGALLSAGYASAFLTAIADAPDGADVSAQVQSQLTKSFDSAAAIAQQHPQYSEQIIQAARQSFVEGQDWAYLAGVIAVTLGGLLVFFLFPKRQHERELLAAYSEADARSAANRSHVGTT